MTLPALTELGLDLWLACTWDQRPPQGLAGICDWRLNGMISHGLKQERLSLGFGKTTLIGADRRLSGARVVLVGLGCPERFDGHHAAQLAFHTAELVHDLASESHALEVPRHNQLIPRVFVGAHLDHCRSAREIQVCAMLIPPDSGRDGAMPRGAIGPKGPAIRAGMQRRHRACRGRRRRM